MSNKNQQKKKNPSYPALKYHFAFKHANENEMPRYFVYIAFPLKNFDGWLGCLILNVLCNKENKI